VLIDANGVFTGSIPASSISKGMTVIAHAGLTNPMQKVLCGYAQNARGARELISKIPFSISNNQRCNGTNRA